MRKILLAVLLYSAQVGAWGSAPFPVNIAKGSWSLQAGRYALTIKPLPLMSSCQEVQVGVFDRLRRRTLETLPTYLCEGDVELRFFLRTSATSPWHQYAMQYDEPTRKFRVVRLK